jgi:plastocyanin
MMKLTFTTCALAACSLGLSGTLSAASLDIDVRDAHGSALADAAVYVESLAGASPMRPHAAEIEQKNRKFMPLMTVIQAGSEISFPNNDTVRHHVYSFSPAKPFELKLYSGTPGSPLVFDKPGTVVIGCNIHDRMVAYIQVVNTPYFGKTNETGKVRINDLPAGKYKLRAWHPQLLSGATMPEPEISIIKQDIAVSIALNPGITSNPQ